MIDEPHPVLAGTAMKPESDHRGEINERRRNGGPSGEKPKQGVLRLTGIRGIRSH
jgi:hypothetical protein